MTVTGPTPDPAGPPGSAQIEKIFTDYFASQGLESEPTAFDGRSDYGPFIAEAVLAGGLFSGAEGARPPRRRPSTVAPRDSRYDPCYHQVCDDINNLNTQALFELGDAAAHATVTLVKSKEGLFEDGSRVAQRSAKAGVKTVGSEHAVVR